MIRLILDVATMRVIYYTRDLAEPLAVVDRTLCYDYQGDLPAGMKPGNSWNYRLVGNQLVNTETAPAKKPSLLESNRKEAQRLLVERINLARQGLLASCHGGEWARRLKLEDTEFLTQLARTAGVGVEEYRTNIENTRRRRDTQIKNSEINRVYYQRMLKEADTNDRILALRDEFTNTDLLELQIK